ncbi:MAG TPA: hypothetical protein VEA19_01160 [Actinomycetota bacterium]|nr:hypothetical protein [Actinomycetota bacterium]
MPSIRIAGALTLAIALAAPAWATHGGIHPTFKTETVYFHCSGPTKVQQVNTANDIYGSAAPWDATPPSQSVVDGAGCGSLEAGGISNEIYDAVFAGTFKGNLRNLTVRIHQFLTNQTRQTASQTLRVYAEVDGMPVFPSGTPEAGYTGRLVTVTPTRVNSGATDLFEFTITNLGYAIDVLDEEGKVVDVQTGGMALEDGDGVEEHSLRLLLGGEDFMAFSGRPGWDAWVWDTTEVPSGITFNPAQLAPAQVPADLPYGS